MGFVPRGFIGALGSLNEVELVLVTAEPGNPLPGETYSGTSPDDYLEGCCKAVYRHFEQAATQYHQNIRIIIDSCFPGLGFRQQMRKVWITDTYQCSAPVEMGNVLTRAWQACTADYLAPQLRLLKNAAVVALGGKARDRMENLGVPFLAAWSPAPPGGNRPIAKESWSLIPEYLHSGNRPEVADRRANAIPLKSPRVDRPIPTERTDARRPSMSTVPLDWANYHLSPTNEAIAIKLYDGIQNAMTMRGLRWRSVPRSGWIAFQRDESKSVLGIQLNSATIKMWVKLPESPDQLRLRGKKVDDPYPQLSSFWRAKDKQWEWEIPTVEAIPDLAPVIDLARRHH